MDINTYLNALPVGGKTLLAKKLGVSPAYLYQMATGIRPVKGTLCRAIEQATNGAVTVHDLRPDVFGPAPANATIDPKRRATDHGFTDEAA